MSFRRRTYPEVLESLLDDLTGGVASESQPFPPPGASAAPFSLALQQPPAADVVSVLGHARRAAARVPQGHRLQALAPTARPITRPRRARVPGSGQPPLRQLRPGGARPDADRRAGRERPAHASRDDGARARADLRAARDRLPVGLRRHRGRRRARQRRRAARDRARARRAARAARSSSPARRPRRAS